MDSGQTSDVVDTHPPDRYECPSFEDFSIDKVKKWRDIDTGLYKLLHTFRRREKCGCFSVILKLLHRTGTILRVWATYPLANALKKRKKTKYIWNHGLMKSEKTGNYFYDFSLFDYYPRTRFFFRHI